MKRRQVKIIVLCEDDAHESFITSYLSNCGYNANKFRVNKPSSGSGKEFVRKEYPNEVLAFRGYRRKNQSQTISLVVLIDQDTPSQPDSYLDLENRLVSSGQAKRDNNEPIAIFSPKRNIETWVYHLVDLSKPVDEITDYSASKCGITNKMCRQAGKLFGSLFWDLPLTTINLPSLAIAVDERQRIPQ